MARSGNGGEGSSGLKKGPWTQAEDKLLVDHVRRHGEGNWNALPGRTDNEIKNYWNTRLKRRLRAGLTLYPPEIEREIAHLRAQNINQFGADGDGSGSGNASLPAPLLYDASNPFALPPAVPSPSASASASASHSPLINQNYPLLNQMQGLHLLQLANQQAPGGAAPQRAFHHDGAGIGLGHGGLGTAGLPPLPTRAHELPSNQFDRASGDIGGAGLLESLLRGDDHPLPRPNPTMLRVGSMPELLYREPSSRLVLHAGGASDSDVASQYPPGEDPHYGGKWDFVFEDVKPSKRRAASAVEEEISDMFGIIPGTIPGEWFSTGGESSAPSPGPSSVVTDDEFSLDMQQFMASLPLPPPLPLPSDEHNWNA
ncbi:hypothetical protein ABZP36_021239 [Zizania latifolia]